MHNVGNLYVHARVVICIHSQPGTVQTSYGMCVQDLEYTQLIHPQNINRGPSRCMDHIIQDSYD